MLNLDLNSRKDTASKSFEILPRGQYLVSCINAETKITKAKTGEFIECTFRVMEGPYEGRMIWTRFNIVNPNPLAQDIGLDQLTAYMLSAGFEDLKLKNVSDLCGKPVIAVVKHKESESGTSAEVSYFKPVEMNNHNTHTTSAGADKAPF